MDEKRLEAGQKLLDVTDGKFIGVSDYDVPALLEIRSGDTWIVLTIDGELRHNPDYTLEECLNKVEDLGNPMALAVVRYIRRKELG